MSADTPNLDDVRAHAQSIIERAKSDSEFSSNLKADPEGTLKEAGFDEQAIPDFARELTDVEAHAGNICTILSCIVTSCSYTRIGL